MYEKLKNLCMWSVFTIVAMMMTTRIFLAFLSTFTFNLITAIEVVLTCVVILSVLIVVGMKFYALYLESKNKN